MADISNLVNRLKTKSAEKGYTFRTSLKLGKDSIRALQKEGFSVEAKKDPTEKRHGLFICKVDWTNPIFSGGKAEELLRISQSARTNYTHV